MREGAELAQLEGKSLDETMMGQGAHRFLLLFLLLPRAPSGVATAPTSVPIPVGTSPRPGCPFSSRRRSGWARSWRRQLPISCQASTGLWGCTGGRSSRGVGAVPPPPRELFCIRAQVRTAARVVPCTPSCHHHPALAPMGVGYLPAAH